MVFFKFSTWCLFVFLFVFLAYCPGTSHTCALRQQKRAVRLTVFSVKPYTIPNQQWNMHRNISLFLSRKRTAGPNYSDPFMCLKALHIVPSLPVYLKGVRRLCSRRKLYLSVMPTL